MSDAAVEKWGVFEAAFDGPSDGNPYLDVAFDAVFTHKSRDVRVPGFYDGNGHVPYALHARRRGRMVVCNALQDCCTRRKDWLPGRNGAIDRQSRPGPRAQQIPLRLCGRDAHSCHSVRPAMPGRISRLRCKSKLSRRWKKLVSTRSGWAYFPKDYPYNVNEPLHPCFERGADGKEDFDRPNPAMFQHFDKQVAALCGLGIEADIIVFHPYDRWGYADMSAEQDFRYVEYLAARLSAYRNVWWSLANEYDFLIDTKPMEQWDRYFHILEENDPLPAPAFHPQWRCDGEFRPSQAMGDAHLHSKPGRQADPGVAQRLRQACCQRRAGI